MSESTVLELLDRVAAAMVLGDRDDRDGFAVIAADLASLAELLTNAGQLQEASICGNATHLAEALAAGKGDAEQALRVLSSGLDALRASLAQSCPPDDAGYPGELTAAPAAPAPAAAPVSAKPATVAAPAAVSLPPLPADTLGLVDEAIMSEFLARQTDELDEIEKELLNVEDGSASGDPIRLLRFFHTLKGESGLLGMPHVAQLCHATEDLMQSTPLTECVERLLDVKDWLMSVMKHYAGDGAQPQPVDEILARVKAGAAPAPATAATEAPAAPPAAVPAASVKAVATPATPVAAAPVVTAAAAPAAAPAAVAPAPVAEPVTPYAVVPYAGHNVHDSDTDLVHDFVSEAVEHLDASEAHLLEIEKDPHESEALNAVFRAFHTIKGLAGFIELEHIKDLAHKAENLLDMARRGEIEMVGGSLDLVFESTDMMKRLVEGVAAALGGDGRLSEEAKLPGLMTRLVAATQARRAAPAPAPAPQVAAASTTESAAPAATVESSTPAPVAGASAAPKKPGTGFIPLSNLKKTSAPTSAAAPQAAASPAPVPVAAPAAVPTTAPAATAPAAGGEDAGGGKGPAKVREAMRVDAERLDHLIETIGELVIAESMVSQSNEMKNSAMSVKLAKDLDRLGKICRELQEIGMSLRMVPVRPVFQKMARLVRDLSKKQGRDVEFVVSGEDTELDKNVVDKIGDPLVHMVRNAVDHGIEGDVNDRLRLGKPAQGRIELRAFHKGGNICIEIEDDGKGLDREAILAKAISRGLLREGDNPSDRELFALIFEPGFSTAKQVTDISGRGVGMDVVRRNIEELRGTVDISSEPGKGSVFSIRLPLTLAIIEGMVIRVGSEHYIIPTLSVVRLIRPQARDVTHVFDRGEMLAFEGSHLPLFRLAGLFDVTEAKLRPEEAMVVVVEDEGRRVGLMADELLGQQSIVIKSLGETMQGTDGVAGGAIMSNGNVALILDVAGLVRVAHDVDTTRHRQAGGATAAAALDRDVAATRPAGDGPTGFETERTEAPMELALTV